MLRLRAVTKTSVRPRTFTPLAYRPSTRLYSQKERDLPKKTITDEETIHSISPELRSLLADKTASQADLEKYVRNMTPEELDKLISSKAFQQHVSETQQAQQQQYQDSEALSGNFPWSNQWGGEEEEEGGYGSSWQDFQDYQRDDALREALSTKFQDKTEGQKTRDFLTGAMKDFRIGTVVLPTELVSRVTLALKGVSRKKLRADAEQLSLILRNRTCERVRPKKDDNTPLLDRNEKVNMEDYKKDPYAKAMRQLTSSNTSIPTVSYDKNQCLAYIAHRVPGIYACNYRVLSEIKMRFGSFRPATMLDFGSGPGTAVWAATQHWPDSIENIRAVEPSLDMMEISKQLLVGFPVTRIQYLQPGRGQLYDLVTASYALSELSDDTSKFAAIRTMWDNVAPGGMLVLIEPGTPIGFQVIRSARAFLLNLHGLDKKNEANIVAPCTHTGKCPMGGGTDKPGAPTWCHYVQRVQRVQLQLLMKRGATRNYENEKFSYIIFSKGKIEKDASGLGTFSMKSNTSSEWARLVRNPIKRGGHVILDVCDPVGLNRYIAAKSSGKQLYRSARKSRWGDGFNSSALRASLRLKNEKLKRPWISKMLERRVKRGEIDVETMQRLLKSKASKKELKTTDEILPHDLD